MNDKNNNLLNKVNNPFKGKGGFMPEKIKEKIKTRVGLNENLAFPLDILQELLQQAIVNIDPRIYPEDYCDSLIDILAKKHDIEPNQIIIGNGGDKIIDLMVRLTIYKGDNAITVNPTYPMYEHAVKIQGGSLKELLLTPAPEFDINSNYILENVNSKKDRLLFLCSPNNPTGNQLDKNEVLKVIKEFPGIVALDETYANFSNYSFIQQLMKFPNLIIMRSFSKYYGLAGMRIGYALADRRLIARIRELHPAFNLNIVSLELAKLVLNQEQVLTEMCTMVKKERVRVYEELAKIDEVIPYKSQTNFLLFKMKKLDAKRIQKELLKKKGVQVRNMSALPHCENSLRVTITTPKNNDYFIQSLKEIIN